MPRNIATKRAVSKTNTCINSSSNTNGQSDSKKVKKLEGSTTVSSEKVCHRKSQRRRIARDIFLVFEEQPNTRRSRGSTKKPLKPKFGHLKIGETIKSKGLLRDIKNETKCNIKGKICNSNSGKNIKSEKLCVTSSIANECSVNITKITEVKRDMSPAAHLSGNVPIAKINPIFLWVKQDDTRIVEVRCEDYDKRNRIRITKTSNGWRAIPCTDPSSSKIVKLYSAPFLKVKREICQETVQQIYQDCNLSENCLSSMNFKEISEDGFNIKSSTVSIKEATKKKKSKKQKRKKNKKVCLYDASVKVQRLPTIELSQTASESVKAGCDIDTTTTQINFHEENVKKSSDLQQCSETYCSETDFEIASDKILNSITNSLSKQTLDVEPAETYQEEISLKPSLQLCPKTGLFLPINQSLTNKLEESHGFDIIDSTCSTVLLVPENADTNHQDSLVLDILENTLRGIENKRISEDITESLEAKTKNLKDLLDDADLLQHCDDNASSDAELIDSLMKTSCEKNLIGDSEILKNKIEMNAQQPEEAISTVDETPKCLSFNEAGEIEGISDLFQANNCIESFAKQTESNQTRVQQAESNSCETMPIIGTLNATSNSPKDLSYKKREEVCPPSESRSQCAVTSSSDVIKSPRTDDESLLASTSVSLKNLLFEQFMNLNTLTHSQNEPIDLGKQRLNSNTNVLKSLIDTVVIDEDDENEPASKRFRSSLNGDVKGVGTMIDQDPDPYTQLQLLLRNSQWKVPDPILVPKDRLGAVLASPAREIPLLITTRPELRLPEAFAYPEIIQNPNILVISMAQLEAILKNDAEVEKTRAISTGQSSSSSSSLLNTSQHQSVPFKTINEISKFNCQTPQIPAQNNNVLVTDDISSKNMNKKCVHVDSNLASGINAATLAVLNQVFWLPYFGQISQDLISSLEKPLAVQQSLPSFLPFYNSQMELQHLEEVYRNYLKQISQITNAGNGVVHLKAENAHENTHGLKNASGKHCQNALNPNERSARSLSYSTQQARQHTEPVSFKNQKRPKTLLPCDILSKPALSLNAIEKNSFEIDGTMDNKLCNPKDINSSRRKTQIKQVTNSQNTQKETSENKPRLTCKSLAHLLDPGHKQQNSFLSSCENPTNSETIGLQKTNTKFRPIVTTKNNVYGAATDLNDLTQSTLRVNSDIINDAKHQRGNTSVNSDLIHQSRSIDGGGSLDAGTPLWHPLFGSTSKPGYCSPWQWTTVTATDNHNCNRSNDNFITNKTKASSSSSNITNVNANSKCINALPESESQFSYPYESMYQKQQITHDSTPPTEELQPTMYPYKELDKNLYNTNNWSQNHQQQNYPWTTSNNANDVLYSSCSSRNQEFQNISPFYMRFNTYLPQTNFQ
uniref:Uncharacterized protein n=1 Tax=Glossina brevipalpis TaxID=37001 RepID=A0A1A9WSV4_9MUSC